MFGKTQAITIYFLFLKGKGCDFKYNSVSYWKQSIMNKAHFVLCLNLTKKHAVLSNGTHFHPDVKVIFEVLTLVTKIYCWLVSPSSNYMHTVTVKLALVRRGSSCFSCQDLSKHFLVYLIYH